MFGPNATQFRLQINQWVEACEKNGRNESPDKAVCSDLEHWFQESLFWGFCIWLSGCPWNKVIDVLWACILPEKIFWSALSSYPLLLTWNNFCQHNWTKEVHGTLTFAGVYILIDIFQFFHWFLTDASRLPVEWHY